MAQQVSKPALPLGGGSGGQVSLPGCPPLIPMVPTLLAFDLNPDHASLVAIGSGGANGPSRRIRIDLCLYFGEFWH